MNKQTESQVMTKIGKCGFAVLIGAPNAGKSTLINALVQRKVAITSRKAQTTRGCTVGVITVGEAQILVRDTPGIFDARDVFTQNMVSAAKAAASEADIVALVHDSARGITDDLGELSGALKGRAKAVLVLNKIDTIRRDKLLEQAAWAQDRVEIDQVFMLSALRSDGVNDLREFMANALPDGPWLFPEDQLSDQPLSRFAAELTREQLFDTCHDELPYSLSVETQSWKEEDSGVIRIEQIIYVSRKSHKPMVIGAGGRNLKLVGTRARLNLEDVLQRKVFLGLRVKVHSTWDRDKRHLNAVGIDC